RFEIPLLMERVQFGHISLLYSYVHLQPDVHYYVVKREQPERAIDEVLVSTGYQNIPKERSTCSFELIDNELLNRSVGTDILSRIENVSNSVLFDRRQIGRASCRERG